MSTTEYTKYVALFHSRDKASSAIRELEAAGFTSNSLTIIGGGEGTGYTDAKGFYESEYGFGSQADLAEIGVPDKDLKHLNEGLQEGGTVLVLAAGGDQADQVEKIFHAHSSKKIDETEPSKEFVAPLNGLADVASTGSTGSTVIPITEEELVVGKREVERGGVRVVRRVVEEPVSQAVSLREEHVVIERHPVDRVATEADLHGGNRTIELTETAEEAVVGKTSRVVEELRVGKEVTEHTETIRDTVRHTEVDLEELPAGKVRPNNY